MNLWKYGLRIVGWKLDISAPRRDKCVICVAPHTSNWDFILGLFAYKSLGREANFLMKDFWFFFPLKYLLRALGGIPVFRGNKKGSLTNQVIELFHNKKYVNLAVTPEGTRSATNRWHTGFLYIACGADVPVQFGVIDYANKLVFIRDEYYPTGDIEKDLEDVKNYYAPYDYCAKYPNKFKI